MKHLALLGAVAAIALATPASAAVTFDLVGVQFVDGGTLAGSLTVSDDLSQLLSFSLTSSSNSGFPYGTFVGRTYTNLNANTFTWNPAQGLWSIYLNPTASLSLFFNQPLTASGATLNQNSAETQIGFRNVVAGSLAAAAVPEPAAWAMMIGGFGLVGAAMRRRVRVSFAA